MPTPQWFLNAILARARFARLKFGAVVLALLASLLPSSLGAVSQLENLGRGVIAVRSTSTQAYVGWRLLGPEYSRATGFNLYRSAEGGEALKLNSTLLTATTDFTDTTVNFTVANAYYVRAVIDGLEQAASAVYTLPANVAVQQYLSVPLQIPAPFTAPDGSVYSYSANDATVGDLDGDGEYEIILKWDPSNAGLGDSNSTGWSSPTIVDAYKINGTRLWRINLGINIRAGSHYTQLTVYDLDGDGKAEFACKTGDGTVDGVGNVIGNATADSRESGAANLGRILTGPEYFTIFNGETGAALVTANYPSRDPISGWGGVGGNGGNDSIGSRADRPQAAIAYLDGKRPSLIFGRGMYGRTLMGAWNWRDGQLTPLWTFDSAQAPWLNHPVTFPYADQYKTLLSSFSGQGNHNLTIGDFDGDGFDEICIGSMTVDHNGQGLYSTGLRHGDAQDSGDLIPSRPGLEVYGVHENEDNTIPWGTPAAAMYDAKTGEILWSHSPGVDAGRGRAADLDPNYPGVEAWGGPGGLRRGDTGVPITGSAPSSANFVVWWDADLTRELLDSNVISKWNWTTNTTAALFTMTGTTSNNSTKSTPALVADIFGDWREEVIMRTTDNTALRIYTTTIPSTNRLYTLMHDRHYRLSVAWQNVNYNQPGNTGFFLGAGMEPAPVPTMATSLAQLLAPTATITGISHDTGRSASDQITSDTSLVLNGVAEAGNTVTLYRAGVGDVGTTVADGAGLWSFDYTGTVLPEGPHEFRVTATDAGGSSGLISNPFTLTVDTTAPAAPVILQVRTGSLVVRGTAAPFSEINVTLDSSVAMGRTFAENDGTWELTYAGSVSAGAHSLTATATDPAGLVSGNSAAFSIDTSVVTPSIGQALSAGVALASGDFTADNTLVLSGSAGPGNTVTLSRLDLGVIGTVVADGSGLWVFDYSATALPEGAAVFTATGSNGSGESPSSASFAIMVDTVSPTVLSIVRQAPSATTITSSVTSVTYRVTFAEDVAGVDTGDFELTATSSAAGVVSGVVPVSAAVFDVTVGTLSGEGTLRLDLKASATGIADGAGNLAGGYGAGQVYTRVIATTGNGTWTQGTSGGLWSEGDNWLNSVIPAANTHSANFATLDLTANNTVVLNSARTVNSLTFGDTDSATAASWLIDNNGTLANTLTLAGTTPTLSVGALGTGATATIGARIAGTAGFTKTGTGTLVLANANTLTGSVIPQAGTIRLATGGSLALTTAVNSTVGAALVVDGGSFTTTGLYTLASGTGSALTLNSGTLSLGSFRITSSGADGATLRINGGTFTTGDISVARSSGPVPAYTSGIVLAGGTSTATTVNLGTGNSSGALTVDGGSFTATGAIVVGSQTSAGRGGGIRVTGGTFTSTNTASGLVLSRINGSNANNVTEALFLGGVSTLEKITLGLTNTVNAGSGTVTINGGTVYLGTGGIVKNGTAAMTTTITLTSGTLGAKGAWSTTHPVALPVDNTVTLKAANASNAPFNITLSGVLSGAGGFTKTGTGTLTLSGANTFTGDVALDEGTLNVTGTLAGGGALAVNVGGLLAGTGTVNKPITLNSNGVVSPAGAAAAGTLTAAALTWNGGGKLAADLGATSDRLALTGALTKGTAGSYEFVFSGSPSVGSTHTLATFASTTFAATDFSHSGLSGSSGRFSISGGNLIFTVTDLPDAAFNAWANALPAGQRAAAADADGDGIANLLEFALGSDGALASARRESNGVLNVAGQDYPTLTYTRRIERSGVDVAVLVSASLDFSATLGAVEVSATAAGNGLETVVVRSAVSLGTQPRQFFRLTASLP